MLQRSLPDWIRLDWGAAMATCVRAHCPIDLNAAPGAVRFVFFASGRRGTIGPGEWIVAVCHQGGSIVSCGGFVRVWICLFFPAPKKKKLLCATR